MSKTIQQILGEAKADILSKSLGKALRTMGTVYDSRPSLYGHDTFTTIQQDYDLMVDYLMRGYADNQRQTLYDQLLRRLYRLVADLEIAWRCKNTPFYIAAFQRAARLNLSPAFLREVLERYVGDVAVLSLDDEATALTKGKELHERHQTFMDRLFCALLTACQWSESEEQAFTELLLLPTIDQADARLMVSAISVSAINQYDLRKSRLLASVYSQADDTPLRQRALVGLTLSLTTVGNQLFHDDATALLLDLSCQSERFADDLAGMQKQLLFCLDADKDHETVQKDIMPTLFKNGNLTVTRFGIEEKEEDAIEGMLHPEAEDEAMEAVERSMGKMRSMFTAGSDVFFGGFSQMKRFPFFNQISNWFVPFSLDHPALRAYREKLGNNRFLNTMFEHGALCDSDKYSFALGMVQIIGRLPDNMREMLKHAEAENLMNESVSTISDAFCRRLYLQDLYRFSRLCAGAGDLRNPFACSSSDGDSLPAFFLGDKLYENAFFDEAKLKVARFLSHRRDPDRLCRLADTITVSTPEVCLLRCLGHLGAQRYEHALSLCSEAFRTFSREEMGDCHEQLLKAKATACMHLDHYDEAAEAYAELTTAHPDNASLAVSHSIALLETQHENEAVDLMFKFNYLQPDNLSVVRVLAWGLLLQGKLEQAERYYRQLLDTKPTAEDWLNAAYAAWAAGSRAEARDRLTAHVKAAKPDNIEDCLRKTFERDIRVLRANKLPGIEWQLMLEAVAHNA